MNISLFVQSGTFLILNMPYFWSNNLSVFCLLLYTQRNKSYKFIAYKCHCFVISVIANPSIDIYNNFNSLSSNLLNKS